MDGLAAEGIVAVLSVLLLTLIAFAVYYATQQLITNTNEFIGDVSEQFENIGDSIIVIANNVQVAVDNAKTSILAGADQLQQDFANQITLWKAEADLFAQRVRETWPCAAKYYTASLLNAVDDIGIVMSLETAVILDAITDSLSDIPDIALAIVDATSALLGCTCDTCQ